MKSELEIIHDLFGKRTDKFTKSEIAIAMRIFADQFRYIKTTCGKQIEFDDLDYEVLRQQALFWDNNRGCVMAIWYLKEGKRIVAPVAKLMLDKEGKTIISYRDGNPLNLKRENIECITHKVAHQKQKKPDNTTSIYKGVSWSKFANKWSAYIKTDYIKKHLGYYTYEEDAAKAYNEAAKEIWGEHARLNLLSKDGKGVNWRAVNLKDLPKF